MNVSALALVEQQYLLAVESNFTCSFYFSPVMLPSFPFYLRHTILHLVVHMNISISISICVCVYVFRQSIVRFIESISISTSICVNLNQETMVLLLPFHSSCNLAFRHIVKNRVYCTF